MTLTADRQLWVTMPIGDSAMERINLPFFYQLGTSLNPLSQMTANAETRINVLIAGFSVIDAISILLERYTQLTVCRTSGQQLINAFNATLKWYQDTPEEKRLEVNPSADFIFNQLVTRAKEFETVLSAELQTFDAYQITQKGIYSTTDLIERAENVLFGEIRAELPKKAIQDFNQAGRCLAFDLPTASGFHTMRAVETTLDLYCKEFNAKPKQRNWNASITELGKGNANKKTLAVLDQIRDLHRNPTMHPDIDLTINEATSLFGIAQSAIVAMVKDIIENRKKKPKPASRSKPGSSGS